MTQLVYILSPSHSGSTLLAMLLATHPDVCTVGELKATHMEDPDGYRCSCRMPIDECEFWRQVSDRMSSQGFSFRIGDAGTHLLTNATRYTRRLLRPLHRGPLLEFVRDRLLECSPAWRRQSAILQKRNAILIEVLSELTGASWIIDSSKTGLRLKYLLRNPALDVRVIRLIRDGRAVSLAYMDPERFASRMDASSPQASSTPPPSMPMKEAARAWCVNCEESDRLIAGLDPSRWIELRYEELCLEPDSVTARLFEFLGLTPRAVAAEFRETEHHVVGNSMRLDRESGVRIDERWRSILTQGDLQKFEAVAGRLNHRYGYSPVPRA